MMNSTSSDWTQDVEAILEAIRQNAVILAKEKKKSYFRLRGNLKYFKIPIIVLSAINSVISVGLTAYVEQALVSEMTCLIALMCGLIGSVELYLSISKTMDDELVSSKEFQLLSMELFKTLNLAPENRPKEAKLYLEKVFQEYEQLIEKSHLIPKSLQDKLSVIPPSMFVARQMSSSNGCDTSSDGTNNV